jgi:hypothetical protein
MGILLCGIPDYRSFKVATGTRQFKLAGDVKARA